MRIRERIKLLPNLCRRIDNLNDMEKDKNLYIGYRWIEDSMKRIIALPLALKFMMPDGRKYDLKMLADAHVAFSFGEHSRILKDEYGQHWYHRQIRMGEMEAYDTYEPIPEDVVSEDYEAKRISGMMIYPYIRVDYARKLMEIYENHKYHRSDEEYREEFYSLNRGFIETIV